MESSTPQLFNQALTTSEVAVTLPTNTKKFSVRARETNIPLRMAFATGGVSSGPYLSIPSGAQWVDDDLHAAIVIYLRTESGTATAEIVAWS